MIFLAKETTIGNSKYVIAYLNDGKELKQQGELHGYTDSTFAVNRKGCTYVYDINNQEIFKHPKVSRYAKDDLETLLEINK